MKIRWSVVSAMAAAALLAACVAGAAATKAPPGKAPDGKDLFTSGKCNTCHSIAAEKIERKKAAAAENAAAPAATAKKKPDLSGVGATKDGAWIAKYLMKEEKLETKMHPSLKYRGTPEELKTLSDWLGSLKTPVKEEASAK
jgi:hypothetical protein